MTFDTDQIANGYREAVALRTGGRSYGDWEWVRHYSTGQLTKLLETVGRELKARGFSLEIALRAYEPEE